MTRFYRRLQERHVWPLVGVNQGQVMQIVIAAGAVWFFAVKVISLYEWMEAMPTSKWWPGGFSCWSAWILLKHFRREGDGIKAKRGIMRHQVSSGIRRVIAPTIDGTRSPVFVVVLSPDQKPSISDRLLKPFVDIACGFGFMKRELPKNRITASEYTRMKFRRGA